MLLLTGTGRLGPRTMGMKPNKPTSARNLSISEKKKSPGTASMIPPPVPQDAIKVCMNITDWKMD